jgi:hypothetical protein
MGRRTLKTVSLSQPSRVILVEPVKAKPEAAPADRQVEPVKREPAAAKP